MGSLFKDYIFENNYGADFEPKGPGTKIHWCIDDEKKKDIYDDLGILGEISPEPKAKETSFTITEEPCLRTRTKSFNTSHHETNPAKIIIPDVRSVRKQQKQMKRMANLHPKMKKKVLGQSPKRRDDFTLTLPCEVLTKIFSFCSAKTKVKCTRVCWRWNEIIMTSHHLWKHTTLARTKISADSLHNLISGHNIQVLCLNNTTIYKNKIPSNLEISSVYLNLHSLDMTNCLISANKVTQILSKCSNLQNVSLEGLPVTPSSLRFLSKCANLIQLNLSLCTEMHPHEVARVLRNNSKLQQLNLSWSNVTLYSPTDIIDNLPPSLTSLNIAGFRETLTDGHVTKLVEVCRKLLHFDCSDSNLITADSVRCVCAGLPLLRRIDVNRCYSVAPNSYLDLGKMASLRHLNVFGILDDRSISMLQSALPRISVCLYPFTSVSRPGNNEGACYGHEVL